GSRNESLVSNLLSRGADARARTSLGYTAAHAAAASGSIATLEILVAAGVDVKARTADGTSTLHGAAEEGHEAMVHHLIGLGVDVNDHAIAEALLKAGSSI